MKFHVQKRGYDVVEVTLHEDSKKHVRRIGWTAYWLFCGVTITKFVYDAAERKNKTKETD